VREAVISYRTVGIGTLVSPAMSSKHRANLSSASVWIFTTSPG
jgi:hypothetical protein